jgi:hypothetical protein
MFVGIVVELIEDYRNYKRLIFIYVKECLIITILFHVSNQYCQPQKIHYIILFNNDTMDFILSLN